MSSETHQQDEYFRRTKTDNWSLPAQHVDAAMPAEDLHAEPGAWDDGADWTVPPQHTDTLTPFENADWMLPVQHSVTTSYEDQHTKVVE